MSGSAPTVTSLISDAVGREEHHFARPVSSSPCGMATASTPSWTATLVDCVSAPHGVRSMVSNSWGLVRVGEVDDVNPRSLAERHERASVTGSKALISTAALIEKYFSVLIKRGVHAKRL